MSSSHTIGDVQGRARVIGEAPGERFAVLSLVRAPGGWLIIAAVAAYVSSLLLPAVGLGTPGWSINGWQALRLTFRVAFGSIFESHDHHLREFAPYLAGAGANVFLAGGLLAGLIWRSRRACRLATLACLAAAVLARLIPLAPRAWDWPVEEFNIGYWIWLGSMLAASVGFWLIA
ncbi:MAG TPA: hypothetical protein VML55_12840, partial [Planctomycetaceae bacterium]|nr:hypothetical protein [Planctomycetaceae bacterium]